jgi:hypothetical protein
MEDLIGKLIEESNRNNRLFVFLFVCLAWSLCSIRNDCVFNDVIISSPDVGIFHAISFMQRWKILSKEKGSARDRRNDNRSNIDSRPCDLRNEAKIEQCRFIFAFGSKPTVWLCFCGFFFVVESLE